MLATLINVGSGSLLKLLGYGISRILESWSESKKQNNDLLIAALEAKTQKTVTLQSGNDTADDWTKYTRRAIAWGSSFTLCFIVSYAALNTGWDAIHLDERGSTGLWGWISGAKTDTKLSIAATVIFRFFDVMEILFGFYFTKLGKS